MDIKVKGIVRYPHLFTPSAPRGSQDRRYSIQILIAKNDPQLAAVQAAVDNAQQTMFPTGMPPGSNTCWHDIGLEPGVNPALANYWALTLSTKETQGQPPVVDAQRQPTIDPGAVQAGDVVWVAGGTQGYNQVSTGVKCYLNATMQTGEKGTISAELLSSRPTVDQMFADVPVAGMPAAPGSPVPVAPPAMPAAPVAPPAMPAHVMLPAAQGATYETCIAAGWTDAAMISNGMMQAPGGVVPSFA